jgi:hypothetical protein
MITELAYRAEPASHSTVSSGPHSVCRATIAHISDRSNLIKINVTPIG